MTRRTTIWRTTTVGAVAVLSLAACGGSDSGSSASTAPSASGTAAASKTDGVLTVGTLLPQTGSLAFLGPPEFAGVKLAVKDINAAGGVLGKHGDRDRLRLRRHHHGHRLAVGRPAALARTPTSSSAPRRPPSP